MSSSDQDLASAGPAKLSIAAVTASTQLAGTDNGDAAAAAAKMLAMEQSAPAVFPHTATGTSAPALSDKMQSLSDYEKAAAAVNKTLPSIFSVAFTLLHQVTDKLSAKYKNSKDRYDKVLNRVSEAKKKGRAAAGDFKKNDGETRTTGFAIGQEGSRLRIITCAHGISETYGYGEHSLSAEDVNACFEVKVTCYHEEKRVLDQLGNKPVNERTRWTTQATVLAVDSRKDLMVFEVKVDEIHCGGEKHPTVCSGQHPPIRMTTQAAAKTEPCVLVAWPAQRMGCLTISNVSHHVRTYPALTQDNPKTYDMGLLEFSGMAVEPGCSGGPIVSSDSGRGLGA